LKAQLKLFQQIDKIKQIPRAAADSSIAIKSIGSPHRAPQVDLRSGGPPFFQQLTLGATDQTQALRHEMKLLERMIRHHGHQANPPDKQGNPAKQLYPNIYLHKTRTQHREHRGQVKGSKKVAQQHRRAAQPHAAMS